MFLLELKHVRQLYGFPHIIRWIFASQTLRNSFKETQSKAPLRSSFLRCDTAFQKDYNLFPVLLFSFHVYTNDSNKDGPVKWSLSRNEIINCGILRSVKICREWKSPLAFEVIPCLFSRSPSRSVRRGERNEAWHSPFSFGACSLLAEDSSSKARSIFSTTVDNDPFPLLNVLRFKKNKPLTVFVVIEQSSDSVD